MDNLALAAFALSIFVLFMRPGYRRAPVPPPSESTDPKIRNQVKPTPPPAPPRKRFP